MNFAWKKFPNTGRSIYSQPSIGCCSLTSGPKMLQLGSAGGWDPLPAQQLRCRELGGGSHV